MKIYIIVGENISLQNVSARAAYSTRAAADAHIADENRMWFDDRAVVVELELDAEHNERELASSVLDAVAVNRFLAGDTLHE